MADNMKNVEEAASLLRKASDMLSNISNSASGSSSRAASAIRDTVQHTRSMIEQSSRGGLYRRLNQNERLRSRATASTSSKAKKARTAEKKAFEFCLVVGPDDDDDEEDEEQTSLLKDSILERGIVMLSDADREVDIREKIASSLQEKYPVISKSDFEFVKVTQKKISVLNLAKGMEYDFAVVKKLVGQGLLYLRLRRGFRFVLEEKCLEGKDLDDPVLGDKVLDDKVLDDKVLDDKDLEVPVFGDKVSDDSTVLDDKGIYELPNNITDPTEMLRFLQKKIVKGRDLEMTDTSQVLEGETNFISVDRDNILQTTFDELKGVKDPSLTFNVQFYGENAEDIGGPRKEWIRLFNQQVKNKYFDHGLKEHLSEDYFFIGEMAAIALLQNGQVPRYFPEQCLQDIFINKSPSSECIIQIQKGMDTLGIHNFARRHPVFLNLLRPTNARLTVPILIHLLQPVFSENGSNSRVYENSVYSKFIKYMREVSSGRRLTTLPNILEFVTGASEEPLLGFAMRPQIKFTPVVFDTSKENTKASVPDFLPKSHTCSNCLELPRPTLTTQLPEETQLFNLYDFAFANTYFGSI